MAESGKQFTINELRAGKTDMDIGFGKSLFGGYSTKQVNDYIRSLKDSLSTAEASFKTRLEEYSTMTSMLTQERDKYKSALSESEAANAALNNKINEMSAELDTLREELSKNTEDAITDEDIKRYERIMEENEKYKDIIESHEDYSRENEMLKQNISIMELTVEDLERRIEEYAENEVSREQYDAVMAENEVIKRNYDEIASEQSILTAEKNVLTENNDRLSESLRQAYDKVRELREINTQTKLKARKIISEYEAKAYECGQNHKQNIEKINENLRIALNILRYEQTDIMKLPGNSFDELEQAGEYDGFDEIPDNRDTEDAAVEDNVLHDRYNF